MFSLHTDILRAMSNEHIGGRGLPLNVLFIEKEYSDGFQFKGYEKLSLWSGNRTSLLNDAELDDSSWIQGAVVR